MTATDLDDTGGIETALPPARAAVVVRTAADVGRLPAALGACDPAVWSSITVVAIGAWGPLARAWAPWTGLTTPERVAGAFADAAAALARQAVDALPPEVAARHMAYDGWRSPPFLQALRSGAFDAVLLLAWPRLWPQRRAVLCAARDGGAAVMRLGDPHRDAPVLRTPSAAPVTADRRAPSSGGGFAPPMRPPR